MKNNSTNGELGRSQSNFTANFEKKEILVSNLQADFVGILSRTTDKIHSTPL
jgi:hypothetical protein